MNVLFIYFLHYSLLKNWLDLQIPSYLSSRRAFSVSPKNEPHKPDSGNNVNEPQSRVPNILTRGLALGSVFLAAYYYGFLDNNLGKNLQSISEYTKARLGDNNTQTSPKQPKLHQASEIIAGNSSQELDVSSSNTENAKQDVETHSELSVSKNSITTEEDKDIVAKDIAVQSPENVNSVEGTDESNVPQNSVSLDDVISKPDEELVKAIEIVPTITSEDKTPADIEIQSVPREQTTIHDMQEVVQGDAAQKSNSLLDDYNLKDNFEELAAPSSEKLKDVSSRIEDVNDGYITKDGKLVLDFLQAIHAAEERQAELDARSFTEEKRALKEKYEKELKDARVRELMYAEREAILDKDLTKERVKAAAALRSLQERLEEKLQTELEQKEMEVEQKLKQMRDIAKAELAAAIATEKASQIEKMAEANLNINALCMAFYARSEEARQSHTAHKLALGALALEDALSKGRPIQKEIETLHTYVEGTDEDSLIPLVLSSLPEDTLKCGTDTLPLLNHKFDALKGTLRHFSLIPPGGGGILSHSLAHIASWLKVKEVDESGDGIESLINRVESLLSQGKLCEAADTLENGIKGSQAAEVVNDWVKRARERAITEQALTILQSYATSISLT
ncbi:micos complex subunit mic60 [Phtheirospermum japonicum]|uniref:Micos complex subunit mic60 n=1 Tax=Phtheirospermum japonicum TaxID=374723 RepID=A0A830C1D7_9LAMI|nr:micos complex subunit mic60 [Phtheirospermum japonicum]